MGILDRPLTIEEVIKKLEALGVLYGFGTDVWLEGCDCIGECSDVVRADKYDTAIHRDGPKPSNYVLLTRPNRPSRL